MCLFVCFRHSYVCLLCNNIFHLFQSVSVSLERFCNETGNLCMYFLCTVVK